MGDSEIYDTMHTQRKHIYVPVFLKICAISKLRCAFCQLLNCVSISKLRRQFVNCSARLLHNLEMEHAEQAAITPLHLLNTR